MNTSNNQSLSQEFLDFMEAQEAIRRWYKNHQVGVREELPKFMRDRLEETQRKYEQTRRAKLG